MKAWMPLRQPAHTCVDFLSVVPTGGSGWTSLTQSTATSSSSCSPSLCNTMKLWLSLLSIVPPPRPSGSENGLPHHCTSENENCMPGLNGPPLLFVNVYELLHLSPLNIWSVNDGERRGHWSGSYRPGTLHANDGSWRMGDIWSVRLTAAASGRPDVADRRPLKAARVGAAETDDSATQSGQRERTGCPLHERAAAAWTEPLVRNA